jgi:alkyl sulfatase BDS1-like metallo-beta-lactamase superfamily hydrolase
LSTGGIKPNLLVENDRPLKFTKGGMDFEIYALPGAEGSDNLVLWLPQKRVLFSGDFFGPLFPQFPNIFTMRGEKIRKPFEYIKSLEKIIDLDPVMIIPSHKDPLDNTFFINEGIRKILGATKHVHDETIKGMNSGKTVEALMREIRLPPELSITQEHGKVSWAVKSIWEYYSTWFHFDRTTELYAVPQSDIYNDLLGIIDELKMQKLIQNYIDRGDFLKALHLIEIVLFDRNYRGPVLNFENFVLKELLKQANDTTKNSYEIYWLNYKLNNNQERLEAQ